MVEIFSELDLRLSVVPRWVVIPTLQNQTVAEHCFNVERIARRIAEQWFSIRDTERLDRVSQLALHHDDDEAITGDIPSPAKAILSEDWLDSRARLWYNAPSPIRDIVKLADLMEMFRFLALEITMGNRYVDDYMAEIMNKALKEYPGLATQWTEWALSMRKMRGTTRGATS
jgi:5'-deoxynucleotidase YfbR-like HD superfamily hydrolase